MERFEDKAGGRRESSVELVGSYALLAEIARGELTSVYLAKKHGALGFQRLYALKRLKSALSKNPSWVELLLDEARLISGIHHANIAGVLDVGTDAGSFVVMEYIEGENLENLLVRAGAARHPRYVVPPFVDALNGLHALHTATSDDGTPSGIVHQAPRARHVLLGVDGTARLIDFSQARAKNLRPSRNRSDRLKVAYMAPELALHPDGVDLRADLFIVGISFWEALTGERLFAADTDEQTFQNMLHRRIPKPSDVGLRPPRCFDAICMRALERDPKNRYMSALEMARDLRDTALNQALYATASELGQWVRHLVGGDLRARRKLAGQDPSSAGGISLETPVAGMDVSGILGDPAQLADGLIALPSSADESSLAAGTAGLDASELADSTAGSLFGDDPYATGRIYGGSEVRLPTDDNSDHELTPALGTRRDKPLSRDDDEPTDPRALVAASLRSGLVFDERARAATLPHPNAPVSAFATAPAEADQTQPPLFVPARPGARRDENAASPGAYSQVDGSRRARASREQITSQARTPARSRTPTRSFESDSVRRALQQQQQQPTADAAPERPASARPSVTRSYAAAERRTGAITEHPPTFVQRRDSSPTRMEIPVGPVGVPHRKFDAEQFDSAPTGQQLGSVASALPRAPLGPLSLPDSLTPPSTAMRSMLPDQPPPRARGSALWLASGVLAAIILLAVGVGLKQWMAGEVRRSSTDHAASGRPSLPSSASAEPPPVSPAARLSAEPAAPAQPPAPELNGKTAASPAAEPQADKPKVKRAGLAKGSKPFAPAAAPSRPASKVGGAAAGLPDNPY